MEQVPSREQEILEARAENQDVLQASWRALVQALILSCADAGDFRHDAQRFFPVILAFAEFVRICHKRKDFYQRAQRLVLLDNLVKVIFFKLPENPKEIQELGFDVFCRKLYAFINGTKDFFHSLRNEEDCAHFSLLREWIEDVLQAAVPNYNPPYVLRREPENQETARTYCQFYKEQQKVKRRLLTRIGPAVAIFLACHSVKGTETGNFDLFRKKGDRLFSPENLLEIRTGDIIGRFEDLKLKLIAAGKLTRELDEALSEEQTILMAILEADPFAVLQFNVVDQVLLILRDMLAHDEAFVLDDFVLVRQTILKPHENLFTVVCRELFVNPDAESEELKLVEGQATVLGTAIQALGVAYLEFEQNFNQECKNLLGEGNLLNPHVLHDLLENYDSPAAQLNILENMYAFIEREINYGENTRLRSHHIELLQNRYLEIVRARPHDVIKERIEESSLLNAPIPGSEVNAKNIALRFLEDATLALSRSPRAVRK